MSRLREIVFHDYSKHYSRARFTIKPTRLPRKQISALNSMFGRLFDSQPRPTKVLDLGCGTGSFLYWLSLREDVIPIGVDFSPELIAIAEKELQNVELHCVDGLNYLLEHKDTFNVILCIDVLEHIADEDTLLEWTEMAHSALTMGGYFICRVPNATNLASTYTRYSDITHARLFT